MYILDAHYTNTIHHTSMKHIINRLHPGEIEVDDDVSRLYMKLFSFLTTIDGTKS